MRTIGLIGGMSWESTVTYYQIINAQIQERLGGLHSARCLLYSVDFAEIERCQAAGEWEKAGEILGDAAEALQCAGADFLLICTNTMHKVYRQVEARVRVPLLHIADATADELARSGVRTVGLLGTKYTMAQDFYRERLVRKGFRVLVPDEADMDAVNRTIYGELCLGVIRADSRGDFVGIINRLVARGAEGVILGCTEIGLLIRPADVGTKLFDTAAIHARRAAQLATEGSADARRDWGLSFGRTEEG